MRRIARSLILLTTCVRKMVISTVLTYPVPLEVSEDIVPDIGITRNFATFHHGYVSRKMER